MKKEKLKLKLKDLKVNEFDRNQLKNLKGGSIVDMEEIDGA